MREAWMDDAACAEIGTDIFFPEEGESNRVAKRICGGCNVRKQCLEFGMAETFGVWGGLSRLERRRLRNAA